MRRFDFPLFADTIFYTAACWLMSVGLFRWLDISDWACFSAATLLALALGAIIFLCLSGKHRRKALSKKLQTEKDKLMLHLALENDESVSELLLTALLADGKNASDQDGKLILDDASLIPIFTMQPISADTVALLLKEYGKAPFIIACNELTHEAEHLLVSFSRRFIQGNEIFELLSRTQKIPEKLICGDIPRHTVRTRLRLAFSKRNAYPFFVSGAGLLVMSLFVFFPIYYLITGSLLLIASICIRALGYA